MFLSPLNHLASFPGTSLPPQQNDKNQEKGIRGPNSHYWSRNLVMSTAVLRGSFFLRAHRAQKTPAEVWDASNTTELYGGFFYRLQRASVIKRKVAYSPSSLPLVPSRPETQFRAAFHPCLPRLVGDDATLVMSRSDSRVALIVIGGALASVLPSNVLAL